MDIFNALKKMMKDWLLDKVIKLNISLFKTPEESLVIANKNFLDF